MKIIMHPDKIKQLERTRKIASMNQDEAGLNVAMPVSENMLKKARKSQEDKERPWDIEETRQLLKVQTEKLQGQTLFAESGREVFKLGVESTNKRVIIGYRLLDLLFEPYLTFYQGNGEVGFAGDVPGEIAVLELEPNETIYAQRPSFIAGIGDIDLSIYTHKLGGLFTFAIGGGSVLLDKLTNKSSQEGLVFLHACGGYDVIDLKENQTITVDIGSVVAWSESVKYKVKKLSFKTGITGEGMFINELTGPGVVMIQTTTLTKLQEKIGETICLGPPPVIVWQLLQKEAKRLFYRIF
ncbi:MAG TPA: AIM24 family protein [Thermodesulfovibrionia bacterium]|nr:AIM24 family protein [Thermodesulfovibrionia bacterium]